MHIYIAVLCTLNYQFKIKHFRSIHTPSLLIKLLKPANYAKLQLFQEFSKEVDAKSSQKSTVLSTGNHLLRLKKVDTASLRAGLSQIDNQWTELLVQIPVVQEKLHQVGQIQFTTYDFIQYTGKYVLVLFLAIFYSGIAHKFLLSRNSTLFSGNRWLQKLQRHDPTG